MEASVVPNANNGGSGGGGCGGGDGEKEKDSIKLFCGNDELVLDILNDDLIAKVRDRITSKLIFFRVSFYFN